MSNATSRSAIAKRTAREAGDSKYEGRPCKHCRMSARYVSCGACCNCACVKADLHRAKRYATIQAAINAIHRPTEAPAAKWLGRNS